MIAKYNKQYFCVDLSVKPVEIWKYDEVKGFEKCIDDGLVYYRKFVNLEEIDEIFDVGFSAKWDNKWCGASPLSNGKVQLICGNRDFALEHEMEEFERGVFWCSADISECTEFRMTKERFLTNETKALFLTKEDFIRWYKLLREDLLPPQK